MFTGRRTRAAEEATHIVFSQPAKNGKGEFSLANNLNRPSRKVNETLRQIFVRFCGLSAVPASIEVGSGWARVLLDHGQAASGGMADYALRRMEEDATGYRRRVIRLVATRAAAHTKSKLNQALRRSARPSFRYTTQAIIPVTAR